MSGFCSNLESINKRLSELQNSLDTMIKESDDKIFGFESYMDDAKIASLFIETLKKYNASISRLYNISFKTVEHNDKFYKRALHKLYNIPIEELENLLRS
jgi:hypothetical protein